MRVLHFSDRHLGVERYGQPVPGTGWRSHTADILRAFDELVAYALSEGVDVVVFTGDAFQTHEPNPTHQREFARRIRRLSDAGVTVYLLAGNHDLPNAAGRAHALEIYRMLDVPGVTIGDAESLRREGRDAITVLETRSGPLQVVSLPWPQRSHFAAARDEVLDMNIESETRTFEAAIIRHLDMQADAVDPDIPAILAGHVTVQHVLLESNPGTERWWSSGKSPKLMPSQLRADVFDYLALGHHHNQVELGMDAPGWYAGSLQAIDFGDEGQRKGFIVFDIDPAKPRGHRIGGSGVPEVVPLETRRFVTVHAAPSAADPTDEICQKIEAASVGDAVVKLNVLLTKEQLQQVRRPAIDAALAPAHQVAGIHYETPRAQRLMLPAGQQPDAASPMEVLDLYFRNEKHYSPERTASLMAAARLIIESVDQEVPL
jgi:exonuclease SbcD